MVFQHFALFPHRTVAFNVAYPLKLQGVDKATREAKADEILSRWSAWTAGATSSLTSSPAA